MTRVFLIFVTAAVFLAFAVSVGAAGEAGKTSPTQSPSDQAQNFFTSINNFYRLGLSLVGISALFMIVWGGIDYLIAGDNMTLVTAGKRKIYNALLGILIAGISYAILYTINPALVQFRIGQLQRPSQTNFQNTGP